MIHATNAATARGLWLLKTHKPPTKPAAGQANPATPAPLLSVEPRTLATVARQRTPATQASHANSLFQGTRNVRLRPLAGSTDRPARRPHRTPGRNARRGRKPGRTTPWSA